MSTENMCDEKAMLREQFYFPHQQNRTEVINRQQANRYPVISELHRLLQISTLAPHSIRTSFDESYHDWGKFSSPISSLEEELHTSNTTFDNNDATIEENYDIKGISCDTLIESNPKNFSSILHKNRRIDEHLQQHESNLECKNLNDMVENTATSLEHTNCRLTKHYNHSHTSITSSEISSSDRHREEKVHDLDRYRRIEDLALYVNSGVINDRTRYFIEPMQRRIKALDELELSQKHGHASSCRGDPRMLKSEESNRYDTVDQSSTCFEDMKHQKKASDTNNSITMTRSAACVIPKKTLESLQVFNSTAGLVKPYAISQSVHFDKHYLDENIPFEAKNCMEAYVTSMRGQRPTKGLHITYEQIKKADETFSSLR